MAGVTDPAHGSVLWEGVLAWRTHLSSVRWSLPGKCEKMSLVCSAFHSKEFSLAWEDGRRLLSGWMEKLTVIGSGLPQGSWPPPARTWKELSRVFQPSPGNFNIKPQNHQTKTMRPSLWGAAVATLPWAPDLTVRNQSSRIIKADFEVSDGVPKAHNLNERRKVFRSLKSEGLRLLNLSSLFFPRVLPEAGPEKAFCVLGAGALNKLKGKSKFLGEILQKLVIKGLEFLMSKKLYFTNQFRQTQGCQ